MDIISLDTTLVKEQFDIDLDPETIGSALQSLLGGAGGQVDIQELIGKVMSSGSLSSIVGTWLGNGENSPIDVEQIFELFGKDKVVAFASDLDIGEETAAAGLTAIIPQLIDKISSGTEDLDSGDALAGIMDMAKKFF